VALETQQADFQPLCNPFHSAQCQAPRARGLTRSPYCFDHFFFLGGVLTVSVTVVFGWRLMVDGVTNRPLIALRLIFLVAMKLTSFFSHAH
jgi:hypothetical protein